MQTNRETDIHMLIAKLTPTKGEVINRQSTMYKIEKLIYYGIKLFCHV